MAWVMVCAALVILMSIPGLALFYGGLVRKKNVLSLLIQIGGGYVVMSAAVSVTLASATQVLPAAETPTRLQRIRPRDVCTASMAPELSRIRPVTSQFSMMSTPRRSAPGKHQRCPG